ncbi:prophage antirepressor-like protein [Robbsia andropogonis]|uniref:BRO-N domain-containing protein n=1 Tax=Robbsia andropogonis TaxID=28092 RepID=UPI003D2134E2
MSNSVITFGFEDQVIRATERNGELWFVLVDICRALSIMNPSQVAARLDKDERALLRIGRQGETVIVTESGLYATIIRSKGAVTSGTPANRFRRWVTREVLPALRKQGFYRNDGCTMHTPETLRGMHREIERLSYALIQSRNHAQRRMLHAMLVDMCKRRGVEPALLAELGQGEATIAEILPPFWRALDELTVQDIAYDHAMRADRLAVNLPDLRKKFHSAGIKLSLDSPLRQALKQSKEPKFEGVGGVRSCITGTVTKCWIFTRCTG